LIVISKNDIPAYKKYLDEAKGVPAQSLWTDLKLLHRNEMLGYPTQKPEALLKRIINASSSENDLVLDIFGGSGTTAAVAEKLKRRWITCDLGRFAVNTLANDSFLSRMSVRLWFRILVSTNGNFGQLESLEMDKRRKQSKKLQPDSGRTQNSFFSFMVRNRFMASPFFME
jgi:hypothetical protein